ncbi:MAG: phosphoribosylglycinamide formyltransferase [bacterium]|jgi:phosphoribosylglycinamide formyltransferase-1|nr:MAG: phosphoribosylglycinamide formyltransferase [bacterium]
MSARIAVFASGGGTNLQALLDHFNRPDGPTPARVALVITDRPGIGALERAERAGVPWRVIGVAGRPEEDVVHETLATLEGEGIGFVALAGYLRRVPADVVRAYHGRMTNIHPALLPAFGGKGMYGVRVHRAVLEAGCKVSGATVHLVDEEYDTGPIIAQWPVPVLPGDTPETLGARVLRIEHRLYPAALEALILGVEPNAEALATAFCGCEADAPAPEEIRRALGLD